jgi:hypothetical protein
MSLEQVLLLAFLVALPLFHYLTRLARQRNELPNQAEGLPPSAHRPPVQEQQPPLPRSARRTASGAMTAPAQETDALMNSTAGRSARRGRAVVGLGNRFDLPRAIVLMTLIGPCRAMDPYEWPQSGGRR